MNVSSINEHSTRNLFIQYANSFMSNPVEDASEITEKSQKPAPSEGEAKKPMGIETLTTFSIYPKQVVNGKTIITA